MKDQRDNQQGSERGTPDDVETDPALDDGSHGDWTSEGGAMPQGPATDSTAARPAEAGPVDA